MENPLPEPVYAQTLINPEQREAHQKAVDDHRIEFVKSLPEKEQQQMKAVEEALGILAKAQVPAYILTLLPDARMFHDIDSLGFYPEELRKLGGYQYNTLGSLMKFDETGKLTPQSLTLISYFNICMASMFMSIYQQKFNHKITDPRIIFNGMYTHQHYYVNWKEGISYDPSIQKIIDEHGPIFT